MVSVEEAFDSGEPMDTPTPHVPIRMYKDTDTHVYVARLEEYTPDGESKYHYVHYPTHPDADPVHVVSNLCEKIGEIRDAVGEPEWKTPGWYKLAGMDKPVRVSGQIKGIEHFSSIYRRSVLGSLRRAWWAHMSGGEFHCRSSNPEDCCVCGLVYVLRTANVSVDSDGDDE